MSLWERWLAPGDLRTQMREEGGSASQHTNNPSGNSMTSALQPASTATASDSPPLSPSPVARLSYSDRERRKNGIFMGGLVFACCSVFITRRAMRKRLFGSYPKFFTTSNGPVAKVNGGLDAVDALFLATLNVCSMFMTAVGFGMVAYDVAEVEDLRAAVKRGVGFDVYGGDREKDKEIESWVREVLLDKDSKSEAGAEGPPAQGDIDVTAALSQGGIIAKLGKLAEFADQQEKLKREQEKGGVQGQILSTKTS